MRDLRIINHCVEQYYPVKKYIVINYCTHYYVYITLQNYPRINDTILNFFDNLQYVVETQTSISLSIVSIDQ